MHLWLTTHRTKSSEVLKNVRKNNTKSHSKTHVLFSFGVLSRLCVKEWGEGGELGGQEAGWLSQCWWGDTHLAVRGGGVPAWCTYVVLTISGTVFLTLVK